MDPSSSLALSGTQWGVILVVTVTVMSGAIGWLARYSWKMHREAVEQGDKRVEDLRGVYDQSRSAQIAAMAVVNAATATIAQLCVEVRELQILAKVAEAKALETKTVLDNRPCLRKEPEKR
jgi:mannose/fructose/N-acetylgalactosamine-specific phosphotransferase system component IID